MHATTFIAVLIALLAVALLVVPLAGEAQHYGLPTRSRAVGSGLPGETEAHTMTCVYCKTGDPTPGRATVTFDREGVTIVIRNVSARICPQCGEQYFDADTTDRLLAMAQEATRAGVSVGIQDYATAVPHR